MHDGALQMIGMSIVRGDYPVGSLLPSKEDLMAQLDVSQTTLREAIQTLTAKGMVAARAKVGTRVLDESHWNIFDADILGWHLEKGIEPSFLAMLFEFRQTFEPTAAALMAQRATEEDMARLSALARQLEAAPNEKETFVSLDIAFHQLIVEASRNPFLQSLGALINTALIAAFMLSAPTGQPDVSSVVRQQHLDIVDAIVARDPQRASEAMLQVIQQGWTMCGGQAATPVTKIAIKSFMRL